ncbi:MAG: Uma2 family endonuclease [Rhodoferax sp.]|uniref:Uma2 family endonuclease n=1 Tax=Rhodoferax sp. TaxID=50421 RepID=UPI003265B49E
MSYAQSQHRFNADTYLVWEANQSERHEYFQGEVFAMAGGTQNHNTVALNAAVALRSHLKGTPCRVFMSDMRLQVVAVDAYFYPDVVVSCQPRAAADGQASSVNAPVLVVEVLSDSTATWDRGGKFAAYRQLPSLQEYVLIDPQAQTVELYRRNAAQRFELYAWDVRTNPGPCEFASVGMQWPLEAVFEGVVADQPADTARADAA